MTKQEVEAAIKDGKAIAIRPGPADLDYRIISAADLTMVGATCRFEPAVFSIDDLVTTDAAARAVGLAFDEPKENGTNHVEARRLATAIEESIGDEQGDGYGTFPVRLTLGQLRRLAARLR